MTTDIQKMEDFRRIIQTALVEDGVESDVTTLSCIDEKATAEAEIVMNSSGIICGLVLIPILFGQLGEGVDVAINVDEGRLCTPGTVIARLNGNAQRILSAERVLLNLLQLASSVATKTAQFVEAVRPNRCDILDTRKTLPGLRSLQKYAVSVGGGKNHRDGLARHIMIKDNHLAHTSITKAITKAREANVPIEIEVDTLKQLREALELFPDAVMLDNMTPEQVGEAVKITGGKTYLEASGGITLSSVASFAKTGVHGVSIGALTHSIDAVDISLNM